MTITTHAEMVQTLEVLVDEVAPIRDFEEAEQQFIVTVDGGRDVAEKTMEGLVETDHIDEEYTVELCRQPDTDEIAVRIVEKELKQVEREATEKINDVMDDVR